MLACSSLPIVGSSAPGFTVTFLASLNWPMKWFISS